MRESEKLYDGHTGSTAAENAMVADVRSTDGKYHRIVLDRSKKLIEFTVTTG